MSRHLIQNKLTHELLLLAALSVITLAPRITQAQHEFTNIKEDLILDDFATTEPKKVYTAKYLIDGIQNSVTGIHLNPMNPCGGGAGGAVCVPLNVPDPDRIGPEARSVPIEALVPGAIGAKVDGLYSETMVKALDENISAPLILQAVSMFLAEPAVAQGVANAKAEASAHHHSMMLDDIRTKQLSELFPGSEPFVKALISCIEEEMVENGRTLVEAKVVCQQDRNWHNITDPGAGVATGFTFKDLEGFDQATLLSNPLNINRITLTDMLFNPETITYPALTGATRIEDVKKSFRSTFGDIEYYMDYDLGNSQAGSSGTWTPRKATYKVLQPSDEGGGHAPEFTYYLKLHTKFDILRWIMARGCNYKNDKTVNGLYSTDSVQAKSFMEAFLATPPAGAFYGQDLPVPLVPVGTFVATGEDALKKLSLPGFAMNPTFILPLIAKLNWSWLPIFIDPLRGRQLRCDELEEPLDPFILAAPNIAPMMSPTPLQDWIDDNVKSVHYGAVPGLYTELLFIARRLALGEFLVEASMAEQIIKHLSSGVGTGMKAEMLSEGLKLIYRAVGTEDIKGSLDMTLNELRTYMAQQILEMDARRMRSGAANSSMGTAN